MWFEMCIKSLYKHELKTGKTIESILQVIQHNKTIMNYSNIVTLKDISDSYTCLGYNTFIRGRKLKNITMGLDSQKLNIICIRYICDCIVTAGNIDATIDIFERNLGPLK